MRLPQLIPTPFSSAFRIGIHPFRTAVARSAGLSIFSLLLLSTIAAADAPPPSTQPTPGPPATTQTDQTNQSLSGILKDSSGAPISSARVEVASEAQKFSATSAADGSFLIDKLPSGTYSLVVRVGERRYTLPTTVTVPAPGASLAITVPSASSGNLTVAMVPLPSSQQPISSSPSTSGGEQLSSKAVSELPLNKRDFSQLLLLAAGTSTDANGATNFTAQFAINGQRGVEAVFAMDGADISDPEMGGATFSNFNVDAVEGIQSSSGWMPAEIGRGAAGFTNILTRSGSSGFHGSFFEFLRNSSLDARNYFDHATPLTPGRIPPFRRNEFGFTNGGPIRIPHLYADQGADGKARSFYFVQYQGFRQVLGTTQVFPVPTAIERSGIDNVSTRQQDGTSLNYTLLVPVDPAIAAVLARYPLPNLPSGAFGEHTYAAASKVITNANQYSIRLDHAITAKDQFLARFNFNNLTGPTTNPDQTAIDPTFSITYIDRQRNVAGIWTHTTSPSLIFESLLSITRSTPGFPTRNHTDPALKFNDALFEAFNAPAGSVMQAYGNLFQGRQMATWTHHGHVVKAGVEVRLNRDTTYFGTSPNGEYDFGGGSAYSTEFIPSTDGLHNVLPGNLLPDTLSGLLSGSPAAYTVAIAPPGVSDGPHTGPAAINRENYTAFLQDTWKATPRLTLDYGLRWELYTPITERAKRTGRFSRDPSEPAGPQHYLVNPQPGYQTSKTGFGPRVQATWQISDKLQVHAGGGITIIPPNIWQDNFLTGSTPYAIYPRKVSAQNAPVPYGYTITPAQLPAVYATSGKLIDTAHPKAVPANTVMDVDRYEKALAALTNTDVISALNLSGMARHLTNARLYTWTAGLERSIGKLTADAAYVGTTSNHLPRISFPNAYPYASPGFAPDTEFNSSGAVIGGLGVENVIDDTAHSSYHALQTSLSGTVPGGGPGIQAGYTWGKSIDDTSVVVGGNGATGAVVVGVSENPIDTHPEKAPSNFDTTHGFTLSVAQDLHGEKAGFLRPISRKATAGWELLSISSISSGAPFTVYSGVQQTGYGSNGADRPDQVAKPALSTARKVRQDYFGKGADNASFFSIPVNLPGGSGPNSGRFGTVGRNTFRGPAFYNFDFSLIKDTPFGTRKSGSELVDLQFRSEFFNIFNIVNMGLPANTLTGSGFGEISRTAGTSRQIQFSLKLIY